MLAGSFDCGRSGTASPRKVNSSSGLVPQWGHSISIGRPSVEVGRRALSLFIDHVAATKAVEAKRRAEPVGFVAGDQMGKAPTGSGRRLEAAVAPAGIEIEPV